MCIAITRQLFNPRHPVEVPIQSLPQLLHIRPRRREGDGFWPGAALVAKPVDAIEHVLLSRSAELDRRHGNHPNVDMATTLRLYAHVTHASTEALVDAIDARYGPRLRVLSEEVLAQYWPIETENGATATETECRERESNPYAA
jgi:hypothetical protein